jgi:hypothetical protein
MVSTQIGSCRWSARQRFALDQATGTVRRLESGRVAGLVVLEACKCPLRAGHPPVVHTKDPLAVHRFGFLEWAHAIRITPCRRVSGGDRRS